MLFVPVGPSLNLLANPCVRVAVTEPLFLDDLVVRGGVAYRLTLNRPGRSPLELPLDFSAPVGNGATIWLIRGPNRARALLAPQGAELAVYLRAHGSAPVSSFFVCRRLG